MLKIQMKILEEQVLTKLRCDFNVNSNDQKQNTEACWGIMKLNLNSVRPLHYSLCRALALDVL